MNSHTRRLVRSSLLVVLALGCRVVSAQDYSEVSCSAQVDTAVVSFYGQASDQTFVIQNGDEVLDLSATYLNLRPLRSKKARTSNVKTEKSKLQFAGALQDEDLVVEIIHDQVVNAKLSKKFDDGCFQGTTGSFNRTVKVISISNRASVLIPLELNQTLKLKCTWQALSPTNLCPETELN